MFVFPHPSQLSMAYSSLPSVTGVVDKPQDVAGVNHPFWMCFTPCVMTVEVPRELMWMSFSLAEWLPSMS